MTLYTPPTADRPQPQQRCTNGTEPTSADAAGSVPRHGPLPGWDAETRFVGSLPFQVTHLDDVVDWVVNVAARNHLPINARFLNAWNVALAREDADYRRLLVQEGINFPDGTPVAWAMNSQRGPGRPAGRVRGPTVFSDVIRKGVPSGVRHYLLGGSPEVLEQLVRALSADYPGVRIVGRYSPPYAPVTSAYVRDCVDRIQPCRPDIVWVGLGTPKQDLVGADLAAALGLAVLNVGAAFDFAAGAVREAPPWVQKSGFEWLFRLAAEPRRLWRRYLIGNVQFLAAVVAERGNDRRLKRALEPERGE
ncbi:MAG: WecB/TagA/CpsF family glycosyltransferase [Actinobacteria bacterium]|nr:WecB/TagA/CpsF family glycosyltransferase [Actinomycetota bacterium]